MVWHDYIKPAGLGNPYYTGLGEVSESVSSSNDIWVTGVISHRDEYVKKFTGHIKDFNVKYSHDGNDIIEVYCEDFSSFLRESFNLYNPTPVDYIQVGYMNKKYSGSNKKVEGLYKPRTFDGWELHRTAQILMTESFIDPYLFYKREQHNGYYNQPIDGNYNILYTDSAYYRVRFETKPYYGNPYIVKESGERADDEYINVADMGQYYYDVLNKLYKPYYIRFGFNGKGYPFLDSFNTPYSYKNITDIDYNTGEWSTVSSFYHMSGGYLHTTSANITASTEFTGRNIEVVFGVGPICGKSSITEDEYGAKITVKKDGVSIVSQKVNLYYATVWGIRDGVAPELGYNPCLFSLDANLDYDDYKLIIETNPDTDNGFDIQLDGVYIYEKQYDTIDKIIDSGDDNNRGAITNLNINDTIKDMRNEVYVYGSLKGPVYAVNEEGQYGIINPNNQLNIYTNSVARDINSLYKSTADNYIGRPMRVLIQDSKLYNENQVDLVSYNVLKTYRSTNKNPNVSILPNPFLEINDCIGFVDVYKGYINTSNPTWIHGMSTRFNLNNGISYTHNIECSPIKPPNGYFYNPESDTAIIGDEKFIFDISINNGGTIMMPYPFDGDGVISDNNNIAILLDTSLYDDSGLNVLRKIPEKGYLRIDGYRKTEIMYYEHTSITSPYIHIKNRGLQGTHTSEFAWAKTSYTNNYLHINLGYDPYTGETMGVYPEIKFKSHSKGRIQIKIFGEGPSDYYHVATLTGIEDDNYPFDGWQNIDWGQNSFIWDGTDQIGVYNAALTAGEISEGGFYTNNNIGFIDLNRKLIPSNYYNTDVTSPQGGYSDLFLTIDFESDDGEFYHTTTRYNKLYERNDGLHIITRLGPKGMTCLKIHTSGLFFNANSIHSTYGMGILDWQGELPPGEHTAYTKAMYYRKVVNEHNKNWTSQNLPSYFKNTSNNNNGLKISLHDVSWDTHTSSELNVESWFWGMYDNRMMYNGVDKYSQRLYKGDIQYHQLTYVGINMSMGEDGNNEMYWNVYHTEGDLIKDNSFRKIGVTKNGIELNFNPKRHITKESKYLQWLPIDCISDLKSLKSNGYFIDNIYVNTLFVFDGCVYDKSGRMAWQRITTKSPTVSGDVFWFIGEGGLNEHIGKTYGLPDNEIRWLILNRELGENEGGTFLFSEPWRNKLGLNIPVDIKYWNLYVDDKWREGMSLYSAAENSMEFKWERMHPHEIYKFKNYIFWNDTDYTHLSSPLSSNSLTGIEYENYHYYTMYKFVMQISKAKTEFGFTATDNYADTTEHATNIMQPTTIDTWYKFDRNAVEYFIGEEF